MRDDNRTLSRFAIRWPLALFLGCANCGASRCAQRKPCKPIVQLLFIAGGEHKRSLCRRMCFRRVRYESDEAAALGAADWLSLATAPTLTIMALLTGVLGSGPAEMLPRAAQDASSLSGMVSMSC